MKTDNLDIVYIVRPGEENEELRYSLRSVAKNFPHRKIFIAGYKPTWISSEVEWIPVNQSGNKYSNAEANWVAAMQDKRITPDFVLFNDDFFIMQPIDELKNYHRGDLADIIAEYHAKQPGSAYSQNMTRTSNMLKRLGVEKPKSYALHIPMIMNREKRQLLCKIAPLVNPNGKDYQMRTLYGNFYRIGGTQTKDVKISNKFNVPKKADIFLSTLDGSFRDGKVGTYIKNTFQEKCRYEK